MYLIINKFAIGGLALVGLLFGGSVMNPTGPANARITSLHVPPLPAVIQLRPEPLPFTPTEFYVADVLDQRAEKTPFANLILRPDKPAEPVDLQGGTGPALEQYIGQIVRRNTKLRPIVLRVTAGKLIETAGPRGSVSGKLALTLAFDVRREDENLSLVTFQGNARYQRPVGQTDVIERTIRQSVNEGLRYLNNYMNKEVDNVPALAGKLAVSLTDVKTRTPASSDTVFYDPDRPLTWDDFRALPPVNNRYAAQIMPGVSYEGKSQVEKGTVNVRLKLKVFMLKSQSWVKPIGHNDYALNHEQRHFDLARLAMEEFKQILNPDSLSLNDYNSNIQYRYIEMYRELGKRQQQYDDETRHGIDEGAQARWNAQIDRELRRYGYK
ncbi:hypothetical protein FAES_0639 [Fibrella aestuarina BUZ 2]|uniref:DUF922 domain-containing protein n=1 Tax=Fibrella aestuarina BUZ 2 TaxID=1166018 RepID=I0K3E7_9BACT|nr:DUF922 domain-containing protein [Fibrella aestuarina]CCG98650.1 hypothetical protein FAES_0639 [Fibrella aestuarina BUZ 2]